MPNFKVKEPLSEEAKFRLESFMKEVNYKLYEIHKIQTSDLDNHDEFAESMARRQGGSIPLALAEDTPEGVLESCMNMLRKIEIEYHNVSDKLDVDNPLVMEAIKKVSADRKQKIREAQKEINEAKQEQLELNKIKLIKKEDLSQNNLFRGKPLAFKSRKNKIKKKKNIKNEYTEEEVDFMRYVNHKKME